MSKTPAFFKTPEMTKKFPLHPKHPERTCWGCDKYCSVTSLQCGNGSGRTQHPAEMLGDDWYTWGDWGIELAEQSAEANPSTRQESMNDHAPAIFSLADLILEQTADAVIYSNRQGLIERWNPAAASMFGYSFAEACGQSLDLIIPEPLRAAHWRGYEAAMASGATRLHGHPTLTRAESKAGARIYVEMSFSLVIDSSGKAMGSVAIARDVSERVLREKATAAWKTGES